MLTINVSRQAEKYLLKIPVKHAKQIAKTIVQLQQDHQRQSIALKGYDPFYRAKSGEYRIIFFVDHKTLHITLIGKRNDDEIYKLIKRFRR